MDGDNGDAGLVLAKAVSALTVRQPSPGPSVGTVSPSCVERRGGGGGRARLLSTAAFTVGDVVARVICRGVCGESLASRLVEELRSVPRLIAPGAIDKSAEGPALTLRELAGVISRGEHGADAETQRAGALDKVDGVEGAQSLLLLELSGAS